MKEEQGGAAAGALPVCVAARVLHFLQLMAEMGEGSLCAGHFEARQG